MSSVQPREGEKMILQEDCAEDNMKNGILTLTNQRLIFEKTEGNMATLSKKPGKVLLDIPLKDILNAKKEGRIIKKIVIKTSEIYKFGVYDTNRWEKTILKELEKNNQMN